MFSLLRKPLKMNMLAMKIINHGKSRTENHNLLPRLGSNKVIESCRVGMLICDFVFVPESLCDGDIQIDVGDLLILGQTDFDKVLLVFIGSVPKNWDDGHSPKLGGI